jgi:(p)ppGpp synthase/HD superfamily hydrolase
MATAAHAGQVDLAGEPYIGHPRRVADRVSHLGEREVMAALLHDVLEDTDVTAEELLERGVPVDVVDTVQILTKRPGEPYEEFVARIVRSGDPIVVAIKLADIADNLDEVRLRQLPPEVARRLCHKYEAARRALTAIALDRS